MRLAFLDKTNVPLLRAEIAKAANPDDFIILRVDPDIARGIASEMLMRFANWYQDTHKNTAPLLAEQEAKLQPGDLQSAGALLRVVEREAPDKVAKIITYIGHTAALSGLGDVLKPLTTVAKPAENDMFELAKLFNGISIDVREDQILHMPRSIGYFGSKQHGCVTVVPDSTCRHGLRSDDDNRREAISGLFIYAQHFCRTFSSYCDNACISQQQRDAMDAAFASFDTALLQICGQMIAKLPPPAQNVGLPAPSATILAFKPRKDMA